MQGENQNTEKSRITERVRSWEKYGGWTKRKASETLNRSNPRSGPKILQYNAGFHLQTMSACLIKTFFRKKEHHRKGKIPLCFFPRKMKDL